MKYRRFLILTLVLIVVMSTATSSFCATDMSTKYKAHLGENEKVYFESIISGWEGDYSIDNVKRISDFAGNPYMIIECSPTGYIIYNEEAGLVMEEAYNSVSPYKDVEAGVYGGPTQYFTKDASGLKAYHTITNVCIDKDVIQEREKQCVTAQTFLVSKHKDLNVLRLMEDNGLSTGSETSTRAVTNTYIDGHKSFFTNLDTKTKMGYYSVGNGACGYVAAGIVLLYYDYYKNDKFITDSTYLNSSGNAFKSNAFTKFLYNDIGVSTLGYSNILNASQVANVMKTYLKNKKSISATCWTTVAVDEDNIIYQLKNRKIPVVYVNRFNNPKNTGTTTDHDIVVYGYDSSDKLITHFGWEGYTHVKCSSPSLAAFVSSACAITYY